MSSDPDRPIAPDAISDDTLLLLNRATLVTHTIRATAHELNNVFQMISGSSELLELNPQFPEALQPKLQAITRHTARGRDLVDAVADLARPTSLGGSVADITRTFARAVQLRSYEHARAGIETTSSVLGEPLVVAADARDVLLMVLNLVVNAEQAVLNVETRKIALTAAANAQNCEIVVADSGHGVLGAEDPFGPLVTTKSPAVAPGLGLTATRVLAGRYGGTIALRDGTSGIQAVLTLPLSRA
jgi:nitrogen fixation/metabolism regulation signal transduction histidine kinase